MGNMSSKVDTDSVHYEEIDPINPPKIKNDMKKPAFKVDTVLFLLAFMRFIVDSSYSIMAPFFPQILLEKNVPDEYNGYIFSTFSLTLILSSPFVGYYLERYERIIFLRVGMLLLAIAMFGFGASTYINDNQTLFLVIVFICRAIQGAASGVNDTTILSITGVLYKDNQDMAIAFILMFSGIGYTLAPLFGSILFQYLGPMAPYWVFGGIQLAFSVGLPCIVSKDVNNRIADSVMSSRRQSILELHDEDLPNSNKPKEAKKMKATFSDYFTHPKIFFAVIAGTMFQYT